jgi:hypothetical protein
MVPSIKNASDESNAIYGDLEDGEKTEMNPLIITNTSDANDTKNVKECVDLVIISKEGSPTKGADEGVGAIEESKSQKCSCLWKPLVPKPLERFIMATGFLFSWSIYLTLCRNETFYSFWIIGITINFCLYILLDLALFYRKLNNAAVAAFQVVRD